MSLKPIDKALLRQFSGTTREAVRVIIHANNQKRAGKPLQMPFGAHTDTRQAYAAAILHLQFYTAAREHSFKQTAEAVTAIMTLTGAPVKIRFLKSIFKVEPNENVDSIAQRMQIMFDAHPSIIEAKEWLDLTRNGRTSEMLDYTAEIKNCITLAGCTLANIGTSEEELKLLTCGAYERYAREWLKNLRIHVRASEPGSNLELKKAEAQTIREYADKAGCTLAYLGTSEEELDELAQAQFSVNQLAQQ